MDTDSHAFDFMYSWRKGWGESQPQPSFDLMPIAAIASYLVMGLIALVILAVIGLWIMGRTRRGSDLVERLILPLPLVGPILRWNLLARWCDALYLGVQAGLDFPACIDIANDAVDSRKLSADGKQMIQRLQAGQDIDTATGYRFLPAIIPASLQLGAKQNSLPATVSTLAKMYQEQAEVRLNVLPSALSPVLLLLITVCVGLSVASALIPMIRLIQGLTR
jgi:type IV pilus assembly protein PilC